MGESNKQSGFTLIELMIVLTLSLFLMLAVIQIFSANSQNFRFSIAFSRMQENGRLALDELARDIRMAGFLVAPVDSKSQLIQLLPTTLLT